MSRDGYSVSSTDYSTRKRTILETDAINILQISTVACDGSGKRAVADPVQVLNDQDEMGALKQENKVLKKK